MICTTDLRAVLESIGELECRKALELHWDEALARRSDSTLDFLQPGRFRVHREWGGLPPEADALLENLAHKILADPALLSLACYGHDRLLFGGDGWLDCTAWPSLEKVLGEDAGLFRMLLALEIVPAMCRVHGERGIPESVTRDTSLVLSGMSWNFARLHKGRIGILARELGWLRNHLMGRLYRLGRMEYMLRPFDSFVLALRHRNSGDVLALAGDGLHFNPRGHIDRPGSAAAEGWTSTLEITTSVAIGHPVSPQGHALRERRALPLDQWDIVLRPGDLTLDMHIPEGGGMTPELCIDSMRRAFEFFGRFFPERPANAVACNSWILGPPLTHILPPEANLISFMREAYLFPVPGGRQDGFFFIFGADDLGSQAGPRDTSLQRAVLDHVSRGGDWRGGGMFFLRGDIERFGSAPYDHDWKRQMIED